MTDIDIAFTDSLRLCVEALTDDRNLTGGIPADLTQAVGFLSQVTGLDRQGLFETILHATATLIDVSDHPVTITGETPGALRCTACGTPLNVHSGAAEVVARIYDMRAVETLINTRPGNKPAPASVTPGSIPWLS